MSELRWTGYQESFYPSYRKFAQLQFGTDSYQASRAYLGWLYCENPHGADLCRDLILGVDQNDRVVGCIHKMRLPWHISGTTVDVPTVHNLMVASEQRRGLGLMLILASFKGEQHAFYPGVVRPLADVYSKLGCQKFKAQWYRQVLRPIKALAQLGIQKLLGLEARAAHFLDRFEQYQDDLHATTVPDEKAFRRLARLMTGRGTAPAWTSDLVAWRFFHPRGPRHLLIENRGGDFIILSVGPRHGLNVGRVLAAHAADATRLASLLKFGAKLLKKHGAVALLTFCADPHMANLLHQLRWRPTADAPSSYFFHRQRRDVFHDYALSGAAGDFGFEALAKEAA